MERGNKMKKVDIVMLFMVAIVAVMIINLTPVQDFVFSFRSFIQPNVWDDIKDRWEDKSSNFLLRKLQSNNTAYFGIANTILVERKEKRAIPVLLRLTKSWDKQRRISAFIALGELKDKRAIEPLMLIAKEGVKHRDYVNVLRALSIMKYEPAFPYVSELARSNSEDRAYAMRMLADYGKPETIPLLEHIAENDSEWDVQENAKEAIEKIRGKIK